MKSVLLSDVAFEGLPGQGRALLRHLLDRGRINLNEAVELLWGQCEDGGPLYAESIVTSNMSAIRAHLRPGWCIPKYPNARSAGWHLIETSYRELAA